MSWVAFFTGSGVIAWGWVIWRALQAARGLPRRLSWALWDHKRAAAPVAVSSGGDEICRNETVPANQPRIARKKRHPCRMHHRIRRAVAWV